MSGLSRTPDNAQERQRLLIAGSANARAARVKRGASRAAEAKSALPQW